jgi:hypothetical protein
MNEITVEPEIGSIVRDRNGEIIRRLPSKVPGKSSWAVGRYSITWTEILDRGPIHLVRFGWGD